MEHVFKGYAIAKIEYGGWGDYHPMIKGALFKIFPTRIDAANWASQHGYDLSSDDGYPEYGIVSVDINPGEYELKE
jgi:hypothetical protein